MMIRVNGEYLDFNDDVEVESQIKLFEEIDSSQGDWSYQSEMEDTNHNRKILGIPLPDTLKIIYRNVVSDLVDDSGFVIYPGTLRIENIEDGKIKFSFFSGNNNWMGLLSEPMSSLPLFKYNVNLTVANIQSSWTKQSGIVFPILDTGVLVSRRGANLKVEDFTSCFYVKTLFNEIFGANGIKLSGDLLKDDLFNNLVVSSNGKSQNDVDDRSSYIQKNTTQSFSGASYQLVTFQNETVFPFFDGAQGNFNITTSQYTADVKMRLKITGTFTYDMSASNQASCYAFVNGVLITTGAFAGRNGDGVAGNTLELILNAGDVFEVRSQSTTGGNWDITNGTIKIEPIFIYMVFGNSSVPLKMTQGEFISNVIRIFNVLPSFNSESKTLTLNLFNKIKDKEEIDISNDVEIGSIDFTEFVSNYGKSNVFKYQEGSDEDLREYNISNFVGYGSGLLPVENDFIEDSVDVLESEFTSPITYLNGVFDCSMERINFVDLDDTDEVSITSITDSSGTPRFNITNADNTFSVGDIIRIDVAVTDYNGDWVVSAVTSTYVEVNGGAFVSSSTGTALRMVHEFTTSDDVYLFANIANVSNLFFSSNDTFILESTSFSSSSIAYFNMLSNGRQVNTKYKQSLSFGTVNNPLSYQKTLLDTYWGIFQDILNDPVMLRLRGFFDRNKFTALKTFLRPLRIKANQTNNLYYLNRISGYKSSSEECEVEVIKL